MTGDIDTFSCAAKTGHQLRNCYLREQHRLWLTRGFACNPEFLVRAKEQFSYRARLKHGWCRRNVKRMSTNVHALVFLLKRARERGGEPFRSGRGRVEFLRARWCFGGFYSEPSSCSGGVRNASKVYPVLFGQVSRFTGRDWGG